MEVAPEQLAKGLAFFKENIPFGKDECWRYIKMMCFGEIVNHICKRCEPFVMSAEFAPKKESNEACKLLLKEQFSTLWDHSLKTMEKSGDFGNMFSIQNTSSD
jgi:hypothetical protein